MNVEGVTGGRLCHSERILVLRPGNAVARGDRVECEEGCGGEGDANVRTCFAGDAGDASAKKVPAGTQSTQRVGVCFPREIRRGHLAVCALSPAGARSGTLAKASAREHARRTRRAVSGTDGRPRPRASATPPRKRTRRYRAEIVMRAGGAGSGSGTRARVRLERRNEPRARDESRASPERAIRTINPAETLDGSRYRRVFASFGPRDEALTHPRVIKEPARAQLPAETRAVRLDRAENAGFERAVGSTYLRRSLKREMHDRGAVRAVVVARLRVRRPIETESQSPFFLLFPTARKGQKMSSRGRGINLRLDAHWASFLNVKISKNRLWNSITRYRNYAAELAGAARIFRRRKTLRTRFALVWRSPKSPRFPSFVFYDRADSSGD